MLVGDGCPCYGGEIKEAVRLARHVEPSNSRVTDDYVELKRADGTATILRIVWRMLPRNGGRALLLTCSYCNTPRRHVYGWEWDSFSGWSKHCYPTPGSADRRR